MLKVLFGSVRVLRSVCLVPVRQEAVMTVERTGPGGPPVRSYRDAALANGPPVFIKRTPTNPLVSQLIGSLRVLLARHPNGVSLTQARRSCPLLEDPDLLKNHPSVRHLLTSMPNVVRLQGAGVQTRIFPPFP